MLFLETGRAVLGGRWDTTVDLSSLGGMASLVVLSKIGPLSPGMQVGYPLQGELTIPIPLETDLLGAAFSAQAAVVTSSRLILTNALDVVLGL